MRETTAAMPTSEVSNIYDITGNTRATGGIATAGTERTPSTAPAPTKRRAQGGANICTAFESNI
jgi:hypothetical protein